jgi:hypothetical protein
MVERIISSIIECAIGIKRFMSNDITVEIQKYQKYFDSINSRAYEYISWYQLSNMAATSGHLDVLKWLYKSCCHKMVPLCDDYRIIGIS